jgi:lipid II:glycine glycyltransferase (peptidoglycan interpeptide bridge formation enzyme)
LYSCSNHLEIDKAIRNQAAKLNRYLHWKDILSLKGLGCRQYDLGGIGNPRIAEFKKGFGGTVVEEYNYIYGAGFKPKISVYSFKLLNKMRFFWSKISKIILERVKRRNHINIE